MPSPASVLKKDTGKQPSRERADGFGDKKPLFDVTFIDRHGTTKNMILFGVEGQDLFRALKEDNRLEIKTEENEKYGEEDTRIKIRDDDEKPPMVLKKTKSGGIQVYDEKGGLPCTEDEEGNIVFLNMKNLAPKKLTKVIIREDNGDKYLKDMKPKTEEGGSFHAGEGKATNGLKFDTWHTWVETEQQKSEHRIAEEKYVEKSQEYFVKTQFNYELILPARETGGSRTENFIHKPEAHEENNGIDHRIWEYSKSEQNGGAEYFRVPVNESKIQNFDASPKTEIEARLYQITNFDAKEFKEEESPIIRCIMDPAFRKIYGAMYGFIDPEEYEAGEVKFEVPKLEKYEENKKTGKKDLENKVKKPKTNEKEQRKEKIEEYKGKKRKKPKKPPRIGEIKKGKEKIARIWRGKKVEPPKIREMRKFEEFLGKEFKMSKIKIQKFKAMMNKLGKEMKYEVNILIQKVQEYFKLKEKLMEIKNQLNKNWILNYSKIELRKLLVEIEYKVQILRKEIVKNLNRIKVKTRNSTNFVLRFGERVKTLRKLERILMLFLLFRALKEN